MKEVTYKGRKIIVVEDKESLFCGFSLSDYDVSFLESLIEWNITFADIGLANLKEIGLGNGFYKTYNKNTFLMFRIIDKKKDPFELAKTMVERFNIAISEKDNLFSQMSSINMTLVYIRNKQRTLGKDEITLRCPNCRAINTVLGYESVFQCDRCKKTFYYKLTISLSDSGK